MTTTSLAEVLRDAIAAEISARRPGAEGSPVHLLLPRDPLPQIGSKPEIEFAYAEVSPERAMGNEIVGWLVTLQAIVRAAVADDPDPADPPALTDLASLVELASSPAVTDAIRVNGPDGNPLVCSVDGPAAADSHDAESALVYVSILTWEIETSAGTYDGDHAGYDGDPRRIPIVAEE